MSVYEVEILTKSPIHLGSGQADVNVDAEVIHDRWGVPYFPAKRFKGLLYESALEVAEMFQLSGKTCMDRMLVDALFQHGGQGDCQLILHDFFLEGHETMDEEWAYLQEKYPSIINPAAVLRQYTDIRYQTKIDQKSGTAAKGSLHNMRVVDAGLKFVGKIEITNSNADQDKLLILALKNLCYAGLKRNRGFGEIECRLVGADIGQLAETYLQQEVVR